MTRTTVTPRLKAVHVRTVCDNAHLVWERMKELADGKAHVDVNMRDVINEMFPENNVHAEGSTGRGKSRKTVTVAAHERAITFHAEISIYLKYAEMVTLIRPPAPVSADGPRPSRWGLANEWVDCDDDIIFERARRGQGRSMEKSANPVRQIHGKADEHAHLEPAEPITPEVIVTKTEEATQVVIDPLTAVQAILTENAELKARVKELEESYTSMAQQIAQRDHLIASITDNVTNAVAELGNAATSLMEWKS